MKLLEAPKQPRLDVLRDAVAGKYDACKANTTPTGTLADHTKRVRKLDSQFMLDCARKFYLTCIEQEDDPLGPIYAKGVHLAQLAHEEVAEDKIGVKFVERWRRFSYLAWEAYQIDVNEYPLVITKEVEL